MLIDKNIGTRLKHTLESIQPYPVIITNQKGEIIAATQSHRVGSVRRNAIQKLNIWPEAPQDDTKNICCIAYNGVVVGTVELCGLTAEDRPYLTMAETIVELLLEKEYTSIQKSGYETAIHKLLTSLVGIHPSDRVQLQKDLDRNGVKLSVPRTTLLIQLSRIEKKSFGHMVREPIIDDRQFSHTVSQFFDQLPMYFSNKDDFILPNPEKHSALVLCADRSTALDVNTISIFNICRELEHIAAYGQLLNMNAVIGNRCCRIEDYERQYEQLEIRLSAGRLLRLDQNVILGRSVVLGSMVLYDALDTRKRITSFIFGDLLASKQRDILLDTLHTYFDCDMNATLTAKQLFIHRNTLQQRLQRIAELTGYSTDTADGLLTLRLGLLQYSSLLYDGCLSSIIPEIAPHPRP
ncbi:hypothetical protein D1159_17055 [Pseudoflavonifractor sp. 524-17]|uniref:helix-turn-helix domain-containing protein n=1 Tax=Pseudoflavonifractor sp. 524-17 TaxID=2304577 RepID=UPI00137AC421|nr:helix-turn-helix domain-containing protein [Pseudoflavonifractor sp. 524-17]NCE66234.1 hypothetical protein [Pseudoflavonifractor sp. 524-17]